MPLVTQKRYCAIKPLHPDGSALSEVFVVEDLQEGTKKILKTLISPNPIAQRLFEQEHKLLRTFRHPGIPRGEAEFSIPLDDNTALPCLVMEYIEGEDLEHWLKHWGGIDQKLALSWLRQLADILHFIHQRGFFHRDIKPANIMRCQTGQLVLIDFGTARDIPQAATGSRTTGSRTVVGTYGYAPPEQWEGQAVPQSDFYALGMTFIHLLTGLHPDQHPISPQTWQHRTIHTIEPRFADLLERMIAREPKHRPANTTALLREIDDLLLADHASSLPLLPAPQRIKPIRLKFPWLLGILILLGTLGLGVWLWKDAPLFFATVCNPIQRDHLSCGEEALVSQVTEMPSPIEKQQGIEAFRQEDYGRAYQLLSLAWENQPDPETLIYKNNAFLRGLSSKNQPIYTLAVVAPLTSPNQFSEVGLALLRGIAQAQDQAIQQGLYVEVLIADDGNDPKQAAKIATALGRKKQLLAVVGHYASQITLSVVPIYQSHRLVLISPTSTAEDLAAQSNLPDHVFFRLTNDTRAYAKVLVRYLERQAVGQKVAVFYNREDSFSRSMHDQFLDELVGSSLIRSRLKSDDLSPPQFDAAAIVEEARSQGITAIALFPSSHTDNFSFRNAMDLIRESQGQFWIVAPTTLHEAEVLQRVGKAASERFVVVVPWHHSNSPDPDFPQIARSYWQGDVNSRTANAHDAVQVLVEALKQNPQNRQALREILAHSGFRARGATGEISFIGSERREATSTLVKVVPSCSEPSASEKSSLSYQFIWVGYDKPCY
jgi:ABC-type branched-subunit amino acid transport system substrate-binding protein